MQEGKQTLRVRLQLLARLTLNAGKHTANQPARLAHLDDDNDRAILVQGNEGPTQIVRLGHRATPSIDVSDEIAILAARPIASLSAGADLIRTFSSTLDGQQFVVSSEFGQSTGARSSEPLQASAKRSSRRAGSGAPSLTVRIRRRHATVALSAVQAHRGTRSSNPLPSSREMLWGGRRGWQFRRLHQSMECRDASAERFEQVPGGAGPR